MRICPCCHKKLPLSEFYRDKSQKDGFYRICKNCRKERNTRLDTGEIFPHKVEINLDYENKIIGGYKVSILNYPSRTEKKYTIAGTDGNYYATNDKGEFFNYLRGIL